MTVEELLSELRQNGVASIEEVAYAILENNGKLSVTPKADQKPLTPTNLRLQIQEKGIAHAVIVDGIVKKEVLNSTGRNRDWLDKVLRQNHCSLPEVFLLTVDDSGHVHIIPKEQ